MRMGAEKTVQLGYIQVHGYDWWRFMWLSGEYFGLFRNRKEVIPGRWGFYVLGFEFGSRNPGDHVGVWLKRNGLWPY
jgi:hypothetical protein